MKITSKNFKELFEAKIREAYGKEASDATQQEAYQALGLMLNDHIGKGWNTHQHNDGKKKMYYLSIEFLIGRLLGSNVLNLRLYDIVSSGLNELGFDFSELEDEERDAALGNGGLGRLAACFLDSLASLDLPGHGCGMRYKHGLFEQKIVDGYQTELPDQWLINGNVWETECREEAVKVRFWGKVNPAGSAGRLEFSLRDYEEVLAVPYDVPVIGYETDTVNTLRLWSAEMGAVPKGKDYESYKREIEDISDMLYPEDGDDAGKILRLKQQYFVVSASIQNIIRDYKKSHDNLSQFHEHVALHINDTHPAMAIPEFMRILLDEERMSWDEAWHISVNTFAYTNHTILAEAMEKWAAPLLAGLLPRVYQIIEEINDRFCQELLSKYPGDFERMENLSIIFNDVVKMAHLCVVGSHSINGVAAVHSDILKKRELNLFYQLYPERFNNKTNGITYRRWLFQCNPQLTKLLKETIGDGFMKDAMELEKLLPFSEDAKFLEQLAVVKKERKDILAKIIERENGIVVNPDSMFIIQVKRLHAYKRQLLNALHIMSLYNGLKENPDLDVPARTFIFGAKAAPGYRFAKKVIKLIHAIADKVNNDPEIGDKLKVVFLENYRVSLAEDVFSAGDISEQISTATKEASGTGNMKFMLNGALTLGTLDGANVEITDAVGEENAFIFGLDIEQVMGYNRHGGYRPLDYYHADKRISRVLEQLVNGFFESVPKEEFEEIYYELLHSDEYFLLKDFGGYADAHDRACATFVDKPTWFKKCAINIAKAGFFSSDRTISEYAKDIWNIHK
ncbi:MAG: glycogen/starch/alpha-glucan phosphorylase [Turicibacter sp.]|nr:glycogen/starch/alpha-glucan phosphorylase [Turicibacter sp.]